MRRLSIALLVLTLAAGACSGGGQEVAGVGGTVFRLSDIRELYEGDAIPIDDGFRETLFRLVAVEALTQGLEDEYGVTVDPAKVEEYYASANAEMAEYGATPADYLGVENASQGMVRFNAGVVALREAAIAQLLRDPDIVDGLFADPATMTTVCVEHILVGTAEEAEAVKARLEAGEEFATVAAEVSLDTSSEGGDLGCAAPAESAAEFASAAMEAPLNEVFGPIQTDYGFHVLYVYERTTLTREEYLADPEGLIGDSQMSDVWAAWFNGVLQAADDAWVAEEYGTWTPLGVVAPATTTTSTAVSEGG